MFSWIGFGGDGVHNAPHLHYIDGARKYSASKIAQIAKEKFEPVSGIEGPAYCPMKATMYAVKKFPVR